MTLIDHTETEDVYPELPIFETDDVLPPDLGRGPKGGAKKGPKGAPRGPLSRPVGPNDGGPEDIWQKL